MEARTRKLVQRANSRPPPKAVLLMAEMVGMGRVERRVKVFRSLERNWATLCDWISMLFLINRPKCETVSHYSLFRRHGQTLLQVSTSAESIIALTGQDERSGAAISTFLV